MKKTVITFLTTIFILSMFVIAPVKALENSIALTKQDDQIVVQLNVGDHQNEALTMQASFKIEAKNGQLEKNQIQFHFDDSIASIVKEYRYDKGLLTLYISGKVNLFADEQLKLGTIEFNVEKNTELNVTFVKDSLEYVSPSYAKTVLDVAQTGIEWDNIEDSDDQDSQQPSDSDPGNDSDKTDEENSSQVIQAENNTSTSQSQTGDHTDILGYVYLALGSLAAVLYLMKRRYQKTH